MTQERNEGGMRNLYEPPKDVPRDREYQVTLTPDQVNLFGARLQRIARREFDATLKHGTLPLANATVAYPDDIRGVAQVAVRMGRAGKLAEKFPVLPGDTKGLPDVEVALTYGDVATIRDAIMQDGGTLQMIDVAEWGRGERETARGVIGAHMDLMDKFYAAGGPENPMLRRANEALLRANRIWGGEAQPGEMIDHL